ncbi:MAG: HEPN domain-containing protein [Anaerolineae bacterium]|nr:HEPN domain-containing protein [Anaerolineae bacterium]
MKPITKAWLDSALDDINAIALLVEEPHLTNVVSFHAQQAVEKSLKALIEEFEIGIIKTHNLNRLYELVKPQYDPIQDLDMLDQLDAIYIESRYPNEMGLLPHGKPSLTEAEQFYNFAKITYHQIKIKLETDEEA